MKLFKTKEDKLADNFEEYLKSMNLDSPNAECEIIDNKLEIIFPSLPYEEYLSFIKNNKYLKNRLNDIKFIYRFFKLKSSPRNCMMIF